MQELWQLYDESGQPIPGQGGSKEEVFVQGKLHGASHVWVWRITNGKLEILLQKRAGGKRTWPHKYDSSAAGHIDLGEKPITAAIRETKEEIGVDLQLTDIEFAGVHRAHLDPGHGLKENEFQWIYFFEAQPETRFIVQESEVENLIWKDFGEFESEVLGDDNHYVPHGKIYYKLVVDKIKSLTALKPKSSSKI